MPPPVELVQSSLGSRSIGRRGPVLEERLDMLLVDWQSLRLSVGTVLPSSDRTLVPM